MPRVLNKREARITPRVLKWFKENYKESVALEIKATSTNSIPKSALKDHQLKALLAVKSERGLTYKIPDNARIRLPFDAFQMKNTQAFVVACFTKRGICLAIPPEEWRGARPATKCEFVIDL